MQGKLEKAEELYQRSLAMRVRVLGPSRPAVAESYNNLAMVLKDAGKFQQAEDMARRCQAIAQQYYAAEHPQVTLVVVLELSLALPLQLVGDASEVHAFSPQRPLRASQQHRRNTRDGEGDTVGGGAQ